MKLFLFYLLSFISCCIAPASASLTERQETPAKQILIVDSYRREVYWASVLSRGIEAALLKLYPQAKITQGNIKSDVALTKTGTTFSLCSILWNLIKDSSDNHSPESLELADLFASSVAPDVLVIIGDEGFLHYLDYEDKLKHWAKVPVVLCAVNELVSAQGWDPLVPDDYNNMVPVEHYRNFERFHSGTCIDYTGVKVRVPVRENLEIIHHLLPELKELVWVDDDYYSSQYIYKQVKKQMEKVMPSVKLSLMLHNRINIDSIYDEMKTVVDGRAFLTWGFNLEASRSGRSEASVDSLFTHGMLPPLFALAECSFNSNEWIGGCYLSHDEIIRETVQLVDRVLKGEQASLIPFEAVEEEKIILNRTAVVRAGLLDEAELLPGATFVHYPPTLFERYEWQLLFAGMVLLLLLSLLIYLLIQRNFDRRIRKNYERYKRLYDNLQIVYSSSSINFAFYGKDGVCLLNIVNGIESTSVNHEKILTFSGNLFQSPFLSIGQRAFLRKNGILNCEIKVDDKAQLIRHALVAQHTYQLIVKELRGNSVDNFGYIAAVVDLTKLLQDRKEKEQLENLFQFAADSAKIGLAFYNIETGKGLSTDAWHRILNEPEIATGLPTYQNVQVDDRVILLEYTRQLLSGKQSSDFCRDIRVVDPEGRLCWVRQNAYYIADHKTLVELSMDIDELKQSEEWLSQAKLEAEQANIETTKFLADISHEIRTPLNSIVGFSAVLMGEEEDREIYIPIILRNCKLLVALINNVLDLSELDSGQAVLKKEWIDIYALQEDMVNYIRSNLYGKPLQVVVTIPEEDRFVYADPVYFQKLSMNLLTNAMKFTETGSISFGHHTVGDYQCFEITDTGCGIREEDMPRIFKRFEKLNPYMQGTGLGLALCKSIVERMGGEIGVRSEWGTGSTFWFSLPKY